MADVDGDSHAELLCFGASFPQQLLELHTALKQRQFDAGSRTAGAAQAPDSDRLVAVARSCVQAGLRVLRDVCVGDVNCDQQVDFVIASADSALQLWLSARNCSTGSHYRVDTLQPDWERAGSRDDRRVLASSVACVDWDDDGWLDVFVLNAASDGDVRFQSRDLTATDDAPCDTQQRRNSSLLEAVSHRAAARGSTSLSVSVTNRQLLSEPACLLTSHPSLSFCSALPQVDCSHPRNGRHRWNRCGALFAHSALCGSAAQLRVARRWLLPACHLLPGKPPVQCCPASIDYSIIGDASTIDADNICLTHTTLYTLMASHRTHASKRAAQLITLAT